jgi:hypothetical protein
VIMTSSSRRSTSSTRPLSFAFASDRDRVFIAPPNRL